MKIILRSISHYLKKKKNYRGKRTLDLLMDLILLLPVFNTNHMPRKANGHKIVINIHSTSNSMNYQDFKL